MSPFVLPMFELHAYLWAFPDKPVERVLILFNRPKTLQEQPLLWNSMLLGRPKTGGTQQLNKLIFSDQSSRRLDFSLHHPVFTIRPLFGQRKLYCVLPELEIRSYDERPYFRFQSLLQIWHSTFMAVSRMLAIPLAEELHSEPLGRCPSGRKLSRLATLRGFWGVL